MQEVQVSVPFLVRFVEQVVLRLEASGEIEIAEGRRSDVILEVAEQMGALGEGHQAIHSLGKALLASDGVEELYADDERLKELVGDLGIQWLRG